jgi:hypothetical protein
MKKRSTRRRVATLVALVALALIVVPGGMTPSSTVVSCTRSALDQGGSSLCTATVFGFSPTGVVVWSPSGNGALTYSSPWCTLYAGQCGVTVNGTNAGSTASNSLYLGDGNNYASNAGNSLTVYRPLTPPVISATPASVRLGMASTLTPRTRFSGGIPPYECNWLQEPPGATSFGPLGSLFGCEPSSLRAVPTGSLALAGAWLFELRVTDSSSLSVSSIPVAVEAMAPTPNQPSISLSCSPSTVRLEFLSLFQSLSPAVCTVSIRGNNLTGIIEWSADLPGDFQPSACETPYPTVSQASCQTEFVPSTGGSPVAITATYSRDPLNPEMHGTTYLRIERATSSTSVSCLPPPYLLNLKTTIKCWVSVDGFSVRGNVTWSHSGSGSVSFVRSACTLSYGGQGTVSQGLCSVTLRGTRLGLVTIRASYGGDSSNLPSKSSTTITVICASCTY